MDNEREYVVTADGRLLDVGRVMAEIEKGQQLAGHFPDAEALARARKVLVGEITAEEAMAEIRAKYLVADAAEIGVAGTRGSAEHG